MCLAQCHLLLRWSMEEVILTTRPVHQGASSCQSRSEVPHTILQTTFSGLRLGWVRSSEDSTGKPRQNTQTRGSTGSYQARIPLGLKALINDKNHLGAIFYQRASRAFGMVAKTFYKDLFYSSKIEHLSMIA